MKSILRRALVCVVAAMLICTLPLAAFAAGEDQSSNLSITVENGNKAISIEGYQCSAYKVMDVTTTEITSGNKSETSYGYTFTEGFENFSYNDLSGNALIAQLTDKETAITDTAELATALSDYAKDNSMSATQTVEVISDNGVEKAVFKDLSAGYYLVTVAPNGGSNQVDACTPMLLLLTDKSETLKAKFGTPTVSKTMWDGNNEQLPTESTVEVGQEVSFKIETFVPTMSSAFEEAGYTFKITDTWTAGLEPNMDSLNVTIDGATVDPATYAVKEGNNSFVISFDEKGFYDSYHTAADAPIVVTYTATITEAMLEKDGQEASNDIKITYSNKPGETTDTPGDPVKVYSLTIDTWKYTVAPGYDAVTSTGEYGVSLSDAQFVLYKKVTGENDTVTNKYYRLEDNKVVWVDDENSATVGRTNNEGHLVPRFAGLAEGTYFLKEIQAPNGFNKVTEDKEIKLSMPASKTDQFTHTEWVENRKGIVLPGTGGIGTIIFYCVGGALVIGALVVLIARRRMSSREK